MYHWFRICDRKSHFLSRSLSASIYISFRYHDTLQGHQGQRCYRDPVGLILGTRAQARHCFPSPHNDSTHFSEYLQKTPPILPLASLIPPPANWPYNRRCGNFCAPVGEKDSRQDIYLNSTLDDSIGMIDSKSAMAPASPEFSPSHTLTMANDGGFCLILACVGSMLTVAKCR